MDKEGQESKKKSAMAVGLKIVIQISQANSNNIVVKSSLKWRKPIFPKYGIPPTSHEYCFLKSCRLCNKNLSPDKDVFMYRGDQGFCSVECRERQIYLDDMREVEASTKKILASFRRRGRCESSVLLEEFRQPLPRRKDRVIFS